MSTASLLELAELVNGQILGATELLISDALPLQDATAGCITLADSAKHVQRIEQSAAAAVVAPTLLEGCSKPLLVVENIHAAFEMIIARLRPDSVRILGRGCVAGISPTAHIPASSTVGDGATIGPNTVIGENCQIGRGCIIHAGVHIMDGCTVGAECEIFPGSVLYPHTKLGDRVLLHANAILGACGFGYRQSNGQHFRTAQLGWVELGDDVEIGASTTIDRGTYGPTKIGTGTKIDNQVQIGHNCHIGRHNLICAQVGVAGSCSTGDYVVLAGQAGLADHVHLADRSMVGAQAGVMQPVGEGEVVLGSPAGPRKQRMQELATMSRLPEMRREIRLLQKAVEKLEQSQSGQDSGSICQSERRNVA